MFSINQIVKAKVSDSMHFIILGFRNDLEKNVMYVQLKSVDPKDHTRMGQGELSLPINKLALIN